jgi:ADP-heptose:LPS heptosyltransferase
MNTAETSTKKRKICVVQLGRIGDLLLITPLCSALKSADPNCEVHVLAGRNNYMIVEGNPYVDRVHVYTKRPFGTVRLLATLLTTKFDVWIDPKEHKSSESSLLARFARAPVKIGYRGDPVFTHPAVLQKSGGEHYTVRSLRNLTYLGIENASPRPSVPPTPSHDAAFAAFRSANNIGKYYAVNISASQPARYWTDDNWVSLLSSLPSSCGPAVFLCEPRDSQRVHAIAGRVRGSHVFPTSSILGTFAVVKNSNMVITVETCIIHVAAVFNTPVVGLYLNMKDFYTQYPPLSDHQRVVLAPHEGELVAAIPLEPVVSAVTSLLEEMT